MSARTPPKFYLLIILHNAFLPCPYQIPYSFTRIFLPFYSVLTLFTCKCLILLGLPCFTWLRGLCKCLIILMFSMFYLVNFTNRDREHGNREGKKKISPCYIYINIFIIIIIVLIFCAMFYVLVL
jgi:L-asparagine transporter-like permease